MAQFNISSYIVRSKKKSGGEEEETEKSWQEQEYRHGGGGGRGRPGRWWVVFCQPDKYSLLLVHSSCDFFSECSNKRKIVKSRQSSSSKRFHDFSVVRTYDQRFPKEIVIILREVMEKLNWW